MRVLFFFPHKPYPPRTGAHKRCIEMITGLKEIGWEVTLLSSTLFSDSKWNRAGIESLRKNLGIVVRVQEASILDRMLRKWLWTAYYRIGSIPPLTSIFYTPPGIRRWFRRIFDEISPDAVFINYAYWDGLLDRRLADAVTTFIETHDLITLNAQMQQVLRRYLSGPLIDIDRIEGDILEEDFFDKLNLSVKQEELRIYDRYDNTIAISPKEADIIKQNTQKTSVFLIQMTHEPIFIKNLYAGYALFPVGPNLFNIQGYLYFVKRVLPLVRKKVPEFCLQITGFFLNNVSIKPEEGVTISGFVEDLKPVYEVSRFVICPILGATGQQVKIVEAMAHGVPVIALRCVAEASPIKHGVNGFIANNADEFADYVIQLWNNRGLCCRLGKAARDTIAAEFSRSYMIDKLSLMLNKDE